MPLTTLEICHACPHRQRACAGACACYDGVDIMDHAARGECPKGLYVAASGTATVLVPRPPLRGVAVPIPRAAWPLAARVIAKLHTPEDKGIGSTIARVIDPAGGATFKRLYKKITGKDCGCGDRAARLDLLFPYK